MMMTTPLVVITGASSGIGRAVALHFAQLNYHVLAVARRVALLADLQACAPAQIIPVCADISTVSGRDMVIEMIKKIGHLQYLIHNAGIIEPLGQLTQIDFSLWQTMQAVNVDAPLALTQKALPYFSGNDNRILHLSSGAAHLPLQAMAAYSVSKAALFMMYQLLRDELAGSGISVGSVSPGIIDTAMTDRIADDLPYDKYETAVWFKALKTQHEMLLPETVARFLAWLLLKVDPKTFREKEWDIYDRTHHSVWLGDAQLSIPPEIDAQVND
jgi:benzil reductase ((S)-benzoin forming)